MSNRSLPQGHFFLTRRLAAPPARVWQAYADPTQKRKWFVDSGGGRTEDYRLDFRESGTELRHGSFAGEGRRS